MVQVFGIDAAGLLQPRLHRLVGLVVHLQRIADRAQVVDRQAEPGARAQRGPDCIRTFLKGQCVLDVEDVQVHGREVVQRHRLLANVAHCLGHRQVLAAVAQRGVETQRLVVGGVQHQQRDGLLARSTPRRGQFQVALTELDRRVEVAAAHGEEAQHVVAQPGGGIGAELDAAPPRELDTGLRQIEPCGAHLVVGRVHHAVGLGMRIVFASPAFDELTAEFTGPLRVEHDLAPRFVEKRCQRMQRRGGQGHHGT